MNVLALVGVERGLELVKGQRRIVDEIEQMILNGSTHHWVNTSGAAVIPFHFNSEFRLS